MAIPAATVKPVAGAQSTTDVDMTHATSTQRNAFATVKSYLDEYGLGSLSRFVYNEIVASRSPTEVLNDLRATPEFKQRFPAIALRQQAGLPAISPGEYVSYEKSASEQMRNAGLPKGFYDSPSDFTNLIANNVSVPELTSRIDVAKQATYNIPPEVAQRLQSEYGIHPGSGALAAYYLDPNKALPLLQNQFEGAKIGGAADRAGYGGLATSTANTLATSGVTESQAQQGFGTLAHNQQLFQALPGEQTPQISQQQQLAATFNNNTADQAAIEAERLRRASQFSDSAQFASSAQGISGLGRADMK